MDHGTIRIAPDPDVLAAQLTCRREGTDRLTPLDDGRRDPLLGLPDRPREPSTFGMSMVECVKEAKRLRALGWTPDEIAVTLARPVRLELAT